MRKILLTIPLVAVLALGNPVWADWWKDESGHGGGRRHGGEPPDWARGKGVWDGHFKHGGPPPWSQGHQKHGGAPPPRSLGHQKHYGGAYGPFQGGNYYYEPSYPLGNAFPYGGYSGYGYGPTWSYPGCWPIYRH